MLILYKQLVPISSDNVENVIDNSIICGNIHTLITSKSKSLLYLIKDRIVNHSDMFVDIEEKQINNAFLLRYSNGSDILIAHKTYDISGCMFEYIMYDKDVSRDYINELRTHLTTETKCGQCNIKDCRRCEKLCCTEE